MSETKTEITPVGDDYVEDHFDLAYWDTHGKEWVPNGYEYDTLEKAGERLKAKRYLYPNMAFKAIHVKAVISHRDVTNLADYAYAEAQNDTQH